MSKQICDKYNCQCNCDKQHNSCAVLHEHSKDESVGRDDGKKCERYFSCKNYVEGNGWGLNHNYCSLQCKRKDDDWNN